MMAKLTIALMLLFIGCSTCSPMNKKAIEILDRIFHANVYDPRVRPAGLNNTDPNSPVVVTTNFYIRRLSIPDPTKMEYDVQLTFRQQWRDSRLRYDDMGGKLKYLNQQDVDRIWLPDTFFSNELKGSFHNLMKPNMLVRVYPNGDVLYSVRVSLTLSCPMDLRYFPMDNQVCPLILASYGSTTDDLIFVWKEGDPVQITKSLNLPYFTLENFYTDYCNSKTNTGEYSCMKLQLQFKREFSYYSTRLYCPSWILMVLSWVAFWLGRHQVTARVLLGLVTILGLMMLHRSAYELVPGVQKMKPISTWFGTCEFFALGALLELVLVLVTTKNNDDESDVKGIMDSDANIVRRLLARFASKTHPIDLLSRVLFPIAFIIFNIIYWSSY
jgi:anionic glutamate receptor